MWEIAVDRIRLLPGLWRRDSSMWRSPPARIEEAVARRRRRPRRCRPDLRRARRRRLGHGQGHHRSADGEAGRRPMPTARAGSSCRSRSNSRLTVKVAGTVHRFDASVVARLHLAARTRRTAGHRHRHRAARGLRHGGRRPQLGHRRRGCSAGSATSTRRSVKKWCASSRERLQGDEAHAATVIDIAPQIENVWHSAVALPDTPDV